ncbi:response regulator [Fusibacter sp. 3D3]|uniref:response regulator n=1 Tax=Fusibacter sp. 3D3 TaxID=1048380 RepID=UPI000852AF39|nr:response regulator [Fusibacter sp. 3D3]GAU76933.1 response regulator receiver [Fusibacter sp. 3D3]
MVDYSKYKVLIVDDEVEILKALNRGLRTEPYEKFFIDSGQKAIELFAKEEIAVVVTDMRMPGMNGLELLQFIHKMSPDTVKIVLSGYTQLPQILVTINKVDIYKFLTKPWDLDTELKVYIREAIELYHERHSKETKERSLEKKNELYQKLLTEGYEKVDYFLKLYEEMIKTINYHHLLTSEDVRKLSKDLDAYITTEGVTDSTKQYEKEHLIAMHLQHMNTRMNFLNKVFDYSKFSLRAFDLDDLAEFFNKNYQLGEIIEIHKESRRDSYYDNFKQITGVIGEIIENIKHSDSQMDRFVLKADLTNGKHIMVFKIICEETQGLTHFVNEFGKFVSIVVKCIGGVSEMTLRNGAYHISVILLVKEKTNDLFMIKPEVSE